MSNSPARLELVAVTGLPPGTRLPLRLGENIVGRDDWVDVPVPSPLVSRRHAVVRVRPGGLVLVRDLASRNGTRVNGTRVDEEVAMGVGDVLELGDVGLRLLEVNRSGGGQGGTDPAQDETSLQGTALAGHDAPTGLLPRLPGPGTEPVDAATGEGPRVPGTVAGAPSRRGLRSGSPPGGAVLTGSAERGGGEPGRPAARRPPGGRPDRRHRLVRLAGAVLVVVAVLLLVLAGSAGILTRLLLLLLAAVGVAVVVRSELVARK